MAQGLISKLFHRKSGERQEPAPVSVRVEGPEDLVTAATWIEKTPLLLEVPPKLLVMQGGFRYDEQHPFVEALRSGPGELDRFYRTCQPRNLSEYYGFHADTRLGSDLPPWEIPWQNRAKRLPPRGEGGLGAEHGVSFYGPATEEKVELEMHRLTSTQTSIQENGYEPQAFGHIKGHVLHAGGEEGAVFFVRGGKHRAAVLAHLEMETIPVMFRRNFQRVVDINQRRCWPLVRNGSMDVSLASDIFMSYIRKKNS